VGAVTRSLELHELERVERALWSARAAVPVRKHMWHVYILTLHHELWRAFDK
jgi:hypothetical protein